MTPPGSKPGETFCSRTKLRTRSPAPTSSMSENGHLRHDEQAAQPTSRAPESPFPLRVSSAGLERCIEIHSRDAQGRGEAEDEAGDDRHAEREGENGAVEADRVEPRDVAGIDRPNDLQGGPSNRADPRRRPAGRAAGSRSGAAAPAVASLRRARCAPRLPSAGRSRASDSRFATFAHAISSTSVTDPSSDEHRQAHVADDVTRAAARR